VAEVSVRSGTLSILHLCVKPSDLLNRVSGAYLVFDPDHYHKCCRGGEKEKVESLEDGRKVNPEIFETIMVCVKCQVFTVTNMKMAVFVNCGLPPIGVDVLRMK
jgi:hypothetical protein